MKREIKYRAWDGSTMYTQDDCCFTFGKDENGQAGKYWSCYMYEKHGGHYCCDSTEKDVVLMQFTGFFDKNGKEIYEGDILKDGSIQYPRLQSVYWHDRFQWSCMSLINNVFAGSLHNDKYVVPKEMRYEVIGNIYENADLLNG